MESVSIDEELEALFNWNPPTLSLAPDASTSRYSRRPSFYDKHLREDLILKKVVSLSSLGRDIAGVVDITLDSIRERGINLPLKCLNDEFSTTGSRRACDYREKEPMKNEQSVANFYKNTTAIYCAPVASTLALHPIASSWYSILRWDTVPSTSGYAIADGFLRIRQHFQPYLLGDEVPTHEIDCGLLDSLDKRKVDELVEVVKSFPDIMTWEIMSLTVAPAGVMNALMDLTHVATFPWTRCLDKCKRHKTTSFERNFIPDATSTPWTLPSGTSSSSSHDQPAVGARKRSTRPAAIKARREIQSQTAPKPLESKTKRKRDDGNNDHDNDHDDDYKTLTADKFLQQSWAQAVRTDSTLICLHAGSLEYIGVRHRKTQRLYLSDLINPSTCKDPGYGKLHVGLYIAALEDTINRARQVHDQKEHGGSGSADGNFASGQDGDGHDTGGHDPKGGSRGGDGSSGSGHSKRQKGGNKGNTETNRGTAKGKEKKRSDPDSQYVQQMLCEASYRNIALIYLRYGIYDSPIPASFIRKTAYVSRGAIGPTPPPSGDKYHFRPDECMTLTLRSEIAGGATGIVHGATLKLQTSNGKYLADGVDVVVKLAILDKQKARLRHEYAIYQNLALKRVKGLPTVLGMFDDLEEEGPTLLVMTHAGTCLHRKQAVSPSQRSAFLAILREIHKAGVLHCDLRPQNLLLDEFGEANIIDFDRSARYPSKQDKKRESAKLAGILDSLGTE